MEEMRSFSRALVESAVSFVSFGMCCERLFLGERAKEAPGQGENEKSLPDLILWRNSCLVSAFYMGWRDSAFPCH